jgi:hypothetical protein
LSYENSAESVPVCAAAGFQIDQARLALLPAFEVGDFVVGLDGHCGFVSEEFQANCLN